MTIEMIHRQMMSVRVRDLHAVLGVAETQLTKMDDTSGEETFADSLRLIIAKWSIKMEIRDAQ